MVAVRARRRVRVRIRVRIRVRVRVSVRARARARGRGRGRGRGRLRASGTSGALTRLLWSSHIHSRPICTTVSSSVLSSTSKEVCVSAQRSASSVLYTRFS